MTSTEGGGARRRVPDPLDLTRIAFARASSRLALAEAHDAFSDAMLSAFRRELGRSVRSASPLLLSLLDSAGFDLDELAPSIRPAPGWPTWPTLPVGGGADWSDRRGTMRPGSETAWRARAAAFVPDACHCVWFEPPGGERLLVHVVDHSMEVAAWLGSMRLRSLFGAFHLAVPRDDWLPPYPPQVGDELDDLIEHPGLRGRGWRVAAVDRGEHALEHRISVRTGTRDYSLPWSR